ncbi:CPBP family intramembrane glutamic endopeptidase [Polyangium jinanense]|uniref:CPBP family intramembrane metalloprotease n=1 Tax=Polyangium jinanense TaxID=2829994 RepID=A0A9X4APL7_9BACT|nr:type II CAAX endopeptidase family protein [Polyangium jinanense]MDC3953448.1 CPBP family intramembrane metalloprotease [Polyangium jinanense]MDC3979431.1 CPBP family intramembrane metalloprotease [Polyangium jinanense]
MDPDEDERPSSPLLPRPEGGERSMSYLAAAGFAVGTTFVYIFFLAFIGSIRGGDGRTDLVTSFGCQLVATLSALFLILQLHAPDKSIRDYLGVRATHRGFFPLAAMLGIAVQIPANALYDLIVKRWPTGQPREEMLQEELAGGVPKRFLFFVILVLAGPLLEEVFFRGALFRPLRRRYDALGTVLATSTYFAFAHLEWQLVLPIGLVGFSLGLLRSASGSLLPSFIMHGLFNGITLGSVYSRSPTDVADNTPIPLSVTIGGSAATIVLLLLVHLLGKKSELAREARGKDEA